MSTEHSLPASCPLCGADSKEGPTIHHATCAQVEYWGGTHASDNMEGYCGVNWRGSHCVAKVAAHA